MSSLEKIELLSRLKFFKKPVNREASVPTFDGQTKPVVGVATTQMDAYTQPPDPVQVDITIPQIREIMPSLEHIVAELKEAFINGTYGALVGDDTSGRIPTLILRGVMSHINHLHGRPAVPTIFIKGKPRNLSFSDEQRLTHHMFSLAGQPGKQRALIVSEYLYSGGHVQSIGDVIHRAGIPYDIVAIGQADSTDKYRNNGTVRGDGQIFPTHGGLGKCPDLYGKQALTGLNRNATRVYADRSLSRGTVVAVRQDVQAAVAQLVTSHRL